MDKFPSRFVERLQSFLPENEVSLFLEHCTEPLPKVVRLKDLEMETPAGWTLSPTSVPEGFFIDRDNQTEIALGKTLDPQPEEKILDLCAAPGSKTSFLAQRMNHTGLIVANEPSSSRSKKLAANLDRMGSINTAVIQTDGTILNTFFAQEFDKILLDAPCSSEGYGRRDNTFFSKMWSEPKIWQAAKLQKRLIESAWEMLSPGGTMVYSTCTSAPEENECVVQHLLDTFPDTVEILPANLDAIPTAPGLTEWEGHRFEPAITKNAVRFYPHLRSKTWNSESFFVVKLRKTQAVSRPSAQKPTHTTEVTFFKKNQTAEIITRVAKDFGLPKTWPHLFTEGKPAFYRKQNELYLTTPEGLRFMQSNLFRRVGIKIFDKDDNLTTTFARMLAGQATKRVLDLDTNETKRWLEGFDIPCTNSGLVNLKDGTAVLIKHHDFGLGWGKIIKGKVKNKLDRDLVF